MKDGFLLLVYVDLFHIYFGLSILGDDNVNASCGHFSRLCIAGDDLSVNVYDGHRSVAVALQRDVSAVDNDILGIVFRILNIGWSRVRFGQVCRQDVDTSCSASVAGIVLTFFAIALSSHR